MVKLISKRYNLTKLERVIYNSYILIVTFLYVKSYFSEIKIIFFLFFSLKKPMTQVKKYLNLNSISNKKSENSFKYKVV